MRASDAERERVADALRDGVAEGRLTMEEFEERLDAAYRARTHRELEPLVRDLPVPTGTVPGRAVERSGWSARIGHQPTSKTGIAVMGGFLRGGNWAVARRFTALALCGGGQLDLREARFEDRDVVIRCFAVMGGVEVVVPMGAEVYVNGVGILGGFDDKGAGEGTPGAPRITITGLALWGGVSVERKEPKAELRRRREERRMERYRRREERRLRHRERHGRRELDGGK
ncbi:DUF1707 and DUF2154 domain-containing protein [Streptomyces palmae]|uniref:DUF1707 and DUF2154 domain-containing protein n=2 Tax=Streptomyces palmae TaxID=1701085 RepID=A0A4Z0FWW3_9ACTN|nr:DUF1707 and DUF2154 domain-containing protein [Streptomyces palmae]